MAVSTGWVYTDKQNRIFEEISVLEGKYFKRTLQFSVLTCAMVYTYGNTHKKYLPHFGGQDRDLKGGCGI